MKRYQRIILGYVILAVLTLLGADVIVVSTYWATVRRISMMNDAREISVGEASNIAR